MRDVLKCEHCDTELLPLARLYPYVDDLGGKHYFCNDEHKDAWKDSLSAHERLTLLGETGL